MNKEYTYIVQQEANLPAIAKEIIGVSEGKKIYAFYGSMGAGKTTLIKQICKHLHVKDNISSPTYAIINEYSTVANPIYHMDLYRIEKEEEILDLALEEYFTNKVYCFIEWPERVEFLLPDFRVNVYIEVEKDQSRKITVKI